MCRAIVRDSLQNLFSKFRGVCKVRLDRRGIPAAYHQPIYLIRRIGVRQVQHYGTFSMFGEYLPERFTSNILRVVKLPIVILFVKAAKFENAMLAWVFSSHEQRPGGSGDGWYNGLKLSGEPLLHHSRQVRHITLTHKWEKDVK